MLRQDIKYLPRPRAAVFDWDMTLANSWQAIYTALNNTLEKFGHPTWTEEQAKTQSQQALRDYFPLVFGEDKYEEARAFFYDNFGAIHLDYIERMPHATSLLSMLEHNNIPMCIVSNKNKVFLPAEVEKLGLDRYMTAIIGAGTLAKDKPDPGTVYHALDQMNIEAGPHIWYIGDSITDARTAVASGSTNIIINEHYDLIADFPEDVKPDIYFSDIKAFLEALEDYFNTSM